MWYCCTIQCIKLKTIPWYMLWMSYHSRDLILYVGLLSVFRILKMSSIAFCAQILHVVHVISPIHKMYYDHFRKLLSLTCSSLMQIFADFVFCEQLLVYSFVFCQMHWFISWYHFRIDTISLHSYYIALIPMVKIATVNTSVIARTSWVLVSTGVKNASFGKIQYISHWNLYNCTLLPLESWAGIPIAQIS